MLDVYVRSDLVSNGRNEFGTEQEKTEYYIIAESSSGQRIRLDSVSIVNREYTDSQCTEYLERIVTKIKNHLAGGGKLNLDYWYEIDPCYGSQRYIDLDSTGYFYKREKREDSYKN
ncbi:hypothetical protein pEaSNUABM50_00035 [Erwinia phage pEa_SNUABM_50]|uniref:Uncharacterized protein n=3 Tax=Eneladusvirus BF TaxID=2560751 RepID=A0A7L8ZMP8_9CAUD|nr:hypothetical protein pEaSNUABM12_00037 [Erwinia phage pEa_SNUABM_12]QOI71520.1 hypothetical protein pEaSNUABM47_00036 [Erwinia phage pEa_SNUABM_47]QOI72059.1 hypothetical protein pEaSNUABM50_00035 [Erwinia phage pEa_SNUABM_50]QXO11184.1 hypothetical protein pEaSNUABM19_00038 [Erwinia phage pEa_SNUABM_19]QXO11732.1 hypothetical protein pEaSNUABM44_00036 [Erwinia phage pEa_SNUABM_44]QXO12283.1 hypothetical protein pEaSNUABM49_00037 [Erwinia phage pEa_SNUABM_49]